MAVETDREWLNCALVCKKWYGFVKSDTVMKNIENFPFTAGSSIYEQMIRRSKRAYFSITNSKPTYRKLVTRIGTLYIEKNYLYEDIPHYDFSIPKSQLRKILLGGDLVEAPIIKKWNWEARINRYLPLIFKIGFVFSVANVIYQCVNPSAGSKSSTGR